jgi:hypothetical protein
MNKPKAKGTAGETAVKRHAQANGFPLADRLTLSGRFDRGDVQLTVGVIVEVKAGKQAQSASAAQITAWLEETETERENANAAIGLLVTQARGIGNARVGAWDAWFARGSDLAACAEDSHIFNIPVRVTYDNALRMLRTAGWGDPIGAGE